MAETLLPEAESRAAELQLPPVPPGRFVQCEGIPVRECGEPLVTVDDPDVEFLASYRSLGLRGAASTLRLRATVVERLLAAVRSLPSGFSIAVFDGHRSMETVRHLRETALEAAGDEAMIYTADPDSDEVIPPHAAGAAVDLTLRFDGEVLLLGSDFDDFSDRAHTVGAEFGELGCRHLRRLLYWAMTDQGFVNFPFEWWHYSYGDQEWAGLTGAPGAIYGLADPPPTSASTGQEARS